MKDKLALLASWILIPVVATLLMGELYSRKRTEALKSVAYRSHDRYTDVFHNAYVKGIETTSEVNLYGDLCSIVSESPTKDCWFTEGPRRHNFRTDSLGWKTLGEIKDADLIFIGDSFLAGSGGDNMEDQIGAVVARHMGIKTYEAAHPGNMDDYLKRHRSLKSKASPDARYIITVFEGNDFEPIRTNSEGFEKIYTQVRSSVVTNITRYSHLARLIRTYYASYKQGLSKRKRVKVITTAQGHQAISLEQDMVSRSDLKMKEENLAYIIQNAESICALVYIPTASTVFTSNSSLKEIHPTLANQLAQVSKSAIMVLDATKVLREATDNKKSIWWRDDTHWNAKGMELTAREIVHKMSSRDCIVR